jgi:hypothetical protein
MRNKMPKQVGQAKCSRESISSEVRVKNTV